MGRKKGIHRPTPRARKLVRYLAAGKSHAEAAVLAGYSPRNAAQSAYQALECLSKSFPQLMDEAGITDVALIKKYLLPLMSAKRTIYFHHKGKVRDKRVVEALDTRLGSLELAFRLQGSF